MGPVPNNFSSIFEHLAEKDEVDIFYTAFPNGSIGEHFKPHPKRDFNDTMFDQDEIITLREVVSKFGKTNTKEIIEISHEEEAWQNNFHDGKKLISYIDAFKLKNM